ncbi:MAG: inosine/xanthosine triphosphatase [Armatimonadota bacterium]|nr:inosine/xanthosine triphosphatase [Armatimonadota bacterium]
MAEPKMRIVIGSTSPSKVEAAWRVLQRAFPGAEIESLEVPSGVSPQPRSMEETVQGAINRAKAALERYGAKLGVGIEGGVEVTPYGVMMCAWVAIMNRDGRLGLGSGPRVMLPESLAVRALAGEELGPIVDDLLGSSEGHESFGTIGLLTKGLLRREAMLEVAVVAALAPFLSPELFDPRKE